MHFVSNIHLLLLLRLLLMVNSYLNDIVLPFGAHNNEKQHQRSRKKSVSETFCNNNNNNVYEWPIFYACRTTTQYLSAFSRMYKHTYFTGEQKKTIYYYLIKLIKYNEKHTKLYMISSIISRYVYVNNVYTFVYNKWEKFR